MIVLLFSLLLHLNPLVSEQVSEPYLEYVQFKEKMIIIKEPNNPLEYKKALNEIKYITLKIDESQNLFQYFKSHVSNLEEVNIPVSLKVKGIIGQLNWHIRRM